MSTRGAPVGRPFLRHSFLGLRRLSRRQRLVVLVCVVQLPALIVLTAAGGAWRLGALVPVALTASYLGSFRGPFTVAPANRAHLYLGLWPFFAWWAACAAFLLLLPVSLVVGWIAGLRVATACGIAGAIAALSGLASVRRTPRVARVQLRFDELPAAFDGYRILQLSDIHCGPFAPERRVADWVRRANAQEADLVVLTGDLIAHGNDHIDAVARALGGLRARDGVMACLGNHDYFGDAERLVRALEAQGIRVLRNAWQRVARDGQDLVVAGVDDSWIGRADVAAALAHRPARGFTMLLAHDPELFTDAAEHGVPLTLSGHTHGGQLGVPFVARRWNLARLITRFTTGLYRQGRSTLYVSRGAGTTGPPIRLGVPSEITVLRLSRASR